MDLGESLELELWGDLEEELRQVVMERVYILVRGSMKWVFAVSPLDRVISGYRMGDVIQEDLNADRG